MSDRHPKPIACFAHRPRPGAALGWLLAVQLGVLTVLGAVFGTLLKDVTENEELVSLDSPIRRFLFEAREPGLDRFFTAITWAGSRGVLIPLVLLVGLCLRWRTRSWRPLVFLAICQGGAAVLSTVIKLIVARPRPPVPALVDVMGYGFPSSHATAAVAGWLSLAIVLGARTSRRVVKVGLGMGAVLLAGLVGLSRIYLGVHEPTDVLGGWSLGALWVVAVLVIWRLLHSRQQPGAVTATGAEVR
ncbi:MAG: phosphatase PAP2 family protein [Actinomycetota bacterium]|nr:phosphatase PAP2 family protein [Actinomycetota bacterium]